MHRGRVRIENGDRKNVDENVTGGGIAEPNCMLRRIKLFFWNTLTSCFYRTSVHVCLPRRTATRLPKITPITRRVGNLRVFSSVRPRRSRFPNTRFVELEARHRQRESSKRSRNRYVRENRASFIRGSDETDLPIISSDFLITTNCYLSTG